MPQYERTPVPAETATAADARARRGWKERFITPAQVAYIKHLVEQCDISSLTEDQQAFFRQEPGTTPMEFASMDVADKMINRLKALPRKDAALEGRMTSQPATGETPGMLAEKLQVPVGRYAVEENGVTKFFHVDRPTEGKWKGYCFIKIRASDDLHPVKDLPRCKRILKLIYEKGVQKAAEEYGQLLGHCGICGRTLTDPVSRDIGIGPVCRARSEWY